jgi:hypothetical protein
VIANAGKTALNVHPVDFADTHDGGRSGSGTVYGDELDAGQCRQLAER